MPDLGLKTKVYHYYLNAVRMMRRFVIIYKYYARLMESKMKNSLTLVTAFVFLIFGGGCFTSALYNKPVESSRQFVEEISSFLISQDGKQLIVVGQRYHYIFAADDTLKFILTSPERKHIKASFNNFVVNSQQTVTGMYTLTLDNQNTLPTELKKQFLAHGFSENLQQQKLSYIGSVQGTRYLASTVQLPATLLLNQKYTIPMQENYPSTAASVEKALLTPLAIAADGLLIIGGIPVLLLTLPFILAQ
jgi:hypothetical protein